MTIYYVDVLLAVGLMVGVMLMCFGFSKNTFSMKVIGGFIAATCVVIEFYLTRGGR